MRPVVLFATLSFPPLVACCFCCGGGGTVAPATVPAATQPAAKPQAHRKRVTRADFGEAWPLTVDAGELECVEVTGRVHVLVIHVGGKTYAVNGTAIDRGYQRIDPIWRDNPRIKGAKMDMGPLLKAARELCE